MQLLISHLLRGILIHPEKLYNGLSLFFPFQVSQLSLSVMLFAASEKQSVYRESAQTIDFPTLSCHGSFPPSDLPFLPTKCYFLGHSFHLSKECQGQDVSFPSLAQPRAL